MFKKILFVLVVLGFFVSSGDSSSPTIKKVRYLGIAVNAYTAEGFEDDYISDAKYFEKALRKLSPYGEIESKLILGKEAQKEAVLYALNHYFDNATENDLCIIYIGTHGTDVLDKGFACIPYGGYIYGNEIERAVKKIRGQVLLMVDTCHAGAIIRDWKNKKDIIIAACKSEELAYNHYFVDAFDESIKTDSDLNSDGVIEFSELEQSLPIKLGKITQLQHTVFFNYFHTDLTLVFDKV